MTDPGVELGRMEEGREEKGERIEEGGRREEGGGRRKEGGGRWKEEGEGGRRKEEGGRRDTYDSPVGRNIQELDVAKLRKMRPH
jgi:hypothetical protein